MRALQRGRRPMPAESRGAVRGGWLNRTLQRGRRPMPAEMALPDGVEVLERRASTGPPTYAGGESRTARLCDESASSFNRAANLCRRRVVGEEDAPDEEPASTGPPTYADGELDIDAAIDIA